LNPGESRKSTRRKSSGQQHVHPATPATLPAWRWDKTHYLVALLNSSLFFSYAKRVFIEKQGGWYEVQPQGLEQFPIPPATPAQEKVLEKLVAQILAAKKADRDADVSGLEREIDQIVYGLYRLTAAEIRVVDPAGQ